MKSLTAQKESIGESQWWPVERANFNSQAPGPRVKRLFQGTTSTTKRYLPMQPEYNSMEPPTQNPFLCLARASEALEIDDRADRTLRKAFLTALLLTASVDQAENAVIAATDLFDPDEGECGEFLVGVLHNAAQAKATYASIDLLETSRSECLVPAELRPVLHLSPQLRRCYVLRVLVGMSRQVCAQLLNLSSRRVDQDTSAALRCLPGLSERPVAGMRCLPS